MDSRRVGARHGLEIGFGEVVRVDGSTLPCATGWKGDVYSWAISSLWSIWSCVLEDWNSLLTIEQRVERWKRLRICVLMGLWNPVTPYREYGFLDMDSHSVWLVFVYFQLHVTLNSCVAFNRNLCSAAEPESLSLNLASITALVYSLTKQASGIHLSINSLDIHQEDDKGHLVQWQDARNQIRKHTGKLVMPSLWSIFP
jgi:hypothetical protein